MFKDEIRKLKVCVEHEDYSAVKEYSMMIRDKYKYSERNLLDIMIQLVSMGEYELIKHILSYY